MGEIKEGRDRRYGFIRSKDDPFQGLEDYSTSPEIRTVTSSANYPINASFDGYSHGELRGGLKVRLGYYFEVLTQMLRGGVVKQSHEVNGNSALTGLRSEPDVRDDTRRILYEAKGVSPGECLKLGDIQIAKYAHNQWGSCYQTPPIIFFEVFRHGINHLVRDFEGKPLEDLVDTLSDKVKFGLVLSYDIIVALHRQRGKNTYTSRYNGDRWNTLTRFLSPGLNAMLAYPEETLQSLGLDPDNYDLFKRRFPQDRIMNGKIIRPFPLLVAKRRNYLEWVEETRNSDGDYYLNLFTLEELVGSTNLGPLFDESEEKSDEGDISFSPEELERMPASEHTEEDNPPF